MIGCLIVRLHLHDEQHYCCRACDGWRRGAPEEMEEMLRGSVPTRQFLLECSRVHEVRRADELREVQGEIAFCLLIW